MSTFVKVITQRVKSVVCLYGCISYLRIFILRHVPTLVQHWYSCIRCQYASAFRLKLKTDVDPRNHYDDISVNISVYMLQTFHRYSTVYVVIPHTRGERDTRL